MGLESLFLQKLTGHLTRKSVRTCSKWAETYRKMAGEFPGPWSFARFPWLREMHDSTAPLNVGQKSAQAGFTETLLNRVFYFIDVKAQSVLYVLPNKTPDAADFSSARFNAALEESPYLSRLFSNVNNVGFKRAGSASVYIRGSQSRAALKSIPVNLVVLDEVDEMCEENIPLVWQRMAGQMEKEAWMVSTPTTEGKGINHYYETTTQEHFHFRCPYCSRLTELCYPECLVITAEEIADPKIQDSYLICRECKHLLPQETKADWLKDHEWVKSYPDRINRGFHINQLYSSTVKPYEIAQKAIAARTNQADEQELYNSILGVTHSVAGSSIDDKDIINCTKGHVQPLGIAGANWGYTHNLLAAAGLPSQLAITMGIDVGKKFHYWIDAWVPSPGRTLDPNDNAYPVTLKTGETDSIEELHPIIEFFTPNSIVIDAQPERHLVYQFCLRYKGRARMCFYIEGTTGTHFKEDDTEDDHETVVRDEPTVKVDRTSWLDRSQGRFKNRTIHLPQNLNNDVKLHLKALTRRPKRDKNGNLAFHWDHNKNKPDHYAHARVYSEIAYPFAAGHGEYTDIVKW